MSRRMLAAVLLLGLATATLAPPALAVTFGPGMSMFAIQLTNGTADLGVEDFGYVSPFTDPEWGVQAEYWHLMSSDYALTISGGASWYSQDEKPGTNAAPTDPELKLSHASWHVRIGGDRVASIGDRAAVYFGPGLEYWSGKAKGEIVGSGSVEGQSTKRFSVGGRIGGFMAIGPSWGLSGHIGHKIGYATVTDTGAKSTWWPSSFDGAGGLTFVFGGAK